ncbi:hypothetical protein P9057_01835 [Gallibacterium anatis]|uniref:Uncharacterized protein n=2 Tax=Gallibacterium anatis TaxID=750 RepID=U1GMX5_9PAST|nr:hypothetical protein [Gallibacterium anatis]ERF78992.1 hypothetical protein N561_03355 [Gallibacterium anatis 12656/12]KGQ32447.1 hypothetical protein JP34_09430 [Gallibacterium anatis]KGQ49532.1 hypothetical protein JL04_05380 [Gallibacterium anatis]KGQ59044.1 hypothetical protein IO48_12340 [Gallibacterium anatis 4895]KGQ65463.1 hypothetical protein IO49_07330 [Gallibacterium anatis]
MKVFIYGFIAIYIGIISGKVFSFLFDKYINDITSNIDFFEPITNSIIGAIIIYFVRLIFPKE